MKIVSWAVKIILAVLVLVLVLNNMQHVAFNFYGIYHWHLPLIVLLFAAIVIGIVLGVLIGTLKRVRLKGQIMLLKKELNKAQQNKQS